MLDKLVTLIKKHQNFLIASHVLPDGDSIGSTVALGLALQSIGKNVTMINNDPVPEMYSFLAGSEKIYPPTVLDRLPGLCILVDCTGFERLGDKLHDLLQTRQPQVLNIDHHISNSNYGSYNLVDPEAAAAGELIYDLLITLGVDMDINMANALYVALVTDTGSFQYENTRGKTLEIAAKLLAAGVDPGKISQALYENRSPISLRLLAAVLPSLTISDDGRLAYMWVDLATMNRLGAESEHCEGFVNYPKSIAGVQVALFFRQMGKDTVKVAFRSKGHIDVNRIAKRFNGGGHPKAAGCTIFGSLQKAINQVVAVVDKELGCL